MSCADFLQGVKVEAALSHLPGELIFFDVDAPLPHVLKTLIDKNILSAPVLESGHGMKGSPNVKNLVGVVTMLDLVIYLVQNVLSDKTSMSSGMAGLFAETEKILLQSTHASALLDLSKTNEVATVSKGATLWEAVQIMARESVHRLIVTSDDGSILQFLTQSAIIRFLASNMEKLGERFNKTLQAAGLAAHVNVFAVETKEKALEAFKLMSQEKLSAVGVIDETGKLVGNISSRDIRMIRDDAEFIQRLYLPASAFLIKMQKAFNVPENPITGNGSETVKDIVLRLAKHGIHRIYVTDAESKPVRVTSMTDILQFVADSE